MIGGTIGPLPPINSRWKRNGRAILVRIVSRWTTDDPPAAYVKVRDVSSGQEREFPLIEFTQHFHWWRARERML